MDGGRVPQVQNPPPHPVQEGPFGMTLLLLGGNFSRVNLKATPLLRRGEGACKGPIRKECQDDGWPRGKR